MTRRAELLHAAYLMRKWALNLRPAPEYLYPDALAKELDRMADQLSDIAETLPKEEAER